jgi:hypothetical protein
MENCDYSPQAFKINLENLKYSVLISVTGIPDNETMMETNYKDFRGVCREIGLQIDETEPGDSEYSYLATESGEPEDGNYWYDWKHKVQDLTANGIINFDQLETLCDETGIYPDGCETMGTLGGPLGGIVRDINFECESESIIVSVRITPFEDIPEDESGLTQLDAFPPSEEEIARKNDAIWEAVKEAVMEKFGY